MYSHIEAYRQDSDPGLPTPHHAPIHYIVMPHTHTHIHRLRQLFTHTDTFSSTEVVMMIHSLTSGDVYRGKVA